VFSPEGNVYSIRYQMGQYKDGSWKLRNLIIESINLGEIYRGQFEAAVEAADGDVDYVISHWDEAAVRVENKESTDGSQ
jgi:phospholipid transport system substrate-binding protein